MKARRGRPRPATWSDRPRARWPDWRRSITRRQELADQAATLEETLADLVRSLRDYLDEIEYNPKRLDEAEERLNLIHNLTRKYGGDIPAVLKFGAEARKQLENISNAGERIAALEAEEDSLLQDAGQAGAGALGEAQGRSGRSWARASRSNWTI